MNTIQLIIFYVVIMAAMIIPSVLKGKKRKQQQQDMIDGFKVGDKVVTIGGIKGEIAAILTETVEIKVDKSVKLTVKKTAISEVLK